MLSQISLRRSSFLFVSQEALSGAAHGLPGPVQSVEALGGPCSGPLGTPMVRGGFGGCGAHFRDPNRSSGSLSKWERPCLEWQVKLLRREPLSLFKKSGPKDGKGHCNGDPAICAPGFLCFLLTMEFFPAAPPGCPLTATALPSLVHAPNPSPSPSPPPHQGTYSSDWAAQDWSADYAHGSYLVLPATDRLLSSPLTLQSHKRPSLSLLVPFLEWAFLGVGTSLLSFLSGVLMLSLFHFYFPFPSLPFFTSCPVSQGFFSYPLRSPRSSTSRSVRIAPVYC